MRKLLGVLALLLVLNSAYIAAFAFPTIFYMGNVLLHVVLGIVTAVLFGWYIAKHREFYRANLGLLAVAAVLGVWLTYSGATTQNRWLVIMHVVFAGVGLAALLPHLFPSRFARALTAALAVLVLLPLGARAYYHWFPNPSDHIRNPVTVPTSMAEEGAGPKSPFWPS